MGSELIYRRHEAQQALNSYSPKPAKPWSSVTRLVRETQIEQGICLAANRVRVNEPDGEDPVGAEEEGTEDRCHRWRWIRRFPPRRLSDCKRRQRDRGG
ncbi:hypothetical protein SLA2020_192470 [Shorea laevis]